MIRANLLPESVIAARRQRRRSALWLRAGVAYALLWVLAVVLSNEVVQDPASDIEAELGSLTAALNGTEASIELLTTRYDTLDGQARVVRDITGHPDWSVLVEHLAVYVGDAIGLRTVNVQLSSSVREATSPSAIAAGPYEVTVLGVATGQAEATRYALDLESAGLFSSLQLTQTSPTRVEQKPAVLFELRGMVGREVTQ